MEKKDLHSFWTEGVVIRGNFYFIVFITCKASWLVEPIMLNFIYNLDKRSYTIKSIHRADFCIFHGLIFLLGEILSGSYGRSVFLSNCYLFAIGGPQSLELTKMALQHCMSCLQNTYLLNLLRQ